MRQVRRCLEPDDKVTGLNDRFSGIGYDRLGSIVRVRQRQVSGKLEPAGIGLEPPKSCPCLLHYLSSNAATGATVCPMVTSLRCRSVLLSMPGQRIHGDLSLL